MQGRGLRLLFIVLTATLRTQLSWLSCPSMTDPNSPVGNKVGANLGVPWGVGGMTPLWGWPTGGRPR